MSAFRSDGEAALDWVAGYLERVGELPVASQVSPGEVRSQLSASPPEQGEPFEAILRDLDAAILPGITHWNHPRFFGYFANTGSEPGILAELDGVVVPEQIESKSRERAESDARHRGR